MALVPANHAAFDMLSRHDQSDSDGSFSLPDVAPGQYMLVAVQDAFEMDLANPAAFSRYLPAGIPVTVKDDSQGLIQLSQPVPVQNR